MTFPLYRHFTYPHEKWGCKLTVRNGKSIVFVGNYGNHGFSTFSCSFTLGPRVVPMKFPWLPEVYNWVWNSNSLARSEVGDPTTAFCLSKISRSISSNQLLSDRHSRLYREIPRALAICPEHLTIEAALWLKTLWLMVKAIQISCCW